MRLLTKMRLFTEGLTLYKTKIMKKLRLAQLKWSFILKWQDFLFFTRKLLTIEFYYVDKVREVVKTENCCSKMYIGRYISNHANILWGVIATLQLTWSARVKWRSAYQCCCIITECVIGKNSTLKLDFNEDLLDMKNSTLKKTYLTWRFFFCDNMMLYSTLMPPHFELLFFHSFILSIG